MCSSIIYFQRFGNPRPVQQKKGTAGLGLSDRYPFWAYCQSPPIKLPSSSASFVLCTLTAQPCNTITQQSFLLLLLDVFCHHTQASKLMSTPGNLLRSASLQATKFSPLTLSCRSLRSVHPALVTSRCLATVQHGAKVLPDVWFTGSVPRRDTPVRSDPSEPRKPNERTVKLGKSKSWPYRLTNPY